MIDNMQVQTANETKTFDTYRTKFVELFATTHLWWQVGKRMVVLLTNSLTLVFLLNYTSEEVAVTDDRWLLATRRL